MSTNDVPPANENEPAIALVLHPDFGDPEQLLSVRKWLERACTAQGAHMTGGGVGMGEADIDIELDGTPDQQSSPTGASS